MDNRIIAAIICIIIGAGLLVVFYRIKYFYKVTIKKWKTAEGKIIHYEAIQDSDGDDYKMEMKYKYEVDGEFYYSSRSTYIFVILMFVDSDKIKSLHTVGDKITVFYNPLNPHKAYLDGNFSEDNYFLVFFSLLLFMIGSFFLVLGL